MNRKDGMSDNFLALKSLEKAYTGARSPLYHGHHQEEPDED